ncbi:MAG: PAS domain S-box protein [Candidatus Marinimicrobia bacterium]|nr:PAS domain S-box protein [Candidatus Neomarinimicrobiota bacterium]
MASSLLDIEPRMRKIRGYQSLWKLRNAIRIELKIQPTILAAETEVGSQISTNFEPSSIDIYHCNSFFTFRSAIYIIALIVILFSINLIARQNDIKFEHIFIDQGLSQNTVVCIDQDNQGFMWFGTQDGLNKYDGYNFTIYKYNPENPNSLSNNYIRTIYKDQMGTLWIGTRAGGLNRFDPVKESFTRFTHQINDPHSLSNNDVRAIFEDRTGTLWIGTYGGGLDKYNPREENFTRYTHDEDNPNSLVNDYVRFIYEDKSGILWLGTRGGLSKFNPSKDSFINYIHQENDPNSLSHNGVWAIHEDRAGLLWIGTSNGLNKFDPSEEIFSHYFYQINTPNSLSSNYIRSILAYRDELWLGTSNGLNKFTLPEENITQYTHQEANSNSLSNNVILSLFEDQTGLVWAGTLSGGINKFDPAKEGFIHYKHQLDDPQSLSQNEVLSICEDRTGILWIGTRFGGLNRFDPVGGSFTHYTHHADNPNSLSHNGVWSIYEDKKGTLWLGTERGLNKFDPVNEIFTHYTHQTNNVNSLSQNVVLAIAEDQTGTLWIGTRGGLNKFDPVQERFTHYTKQEGKPNSLSHNNVKTIYIDKNGILWLGTRGGLNKFDPNKEHFTHYIYQENNSNSLSTDVVLSIYEDQAGTIWLGTSGGGLNKFNRLEEIFTYYGMKDGLPNDVVYGILEDTNNNLWLSTNKGLSKFNPRKISFKNYDIRDGIQSNEFNQGAFYKGKNGDLFFGGINGFNIFSPDNIRDNPHIPPIAITDFQIFNESVSIGINSPLKQHISKTKKIVLAHKDYVFSFEFAALHYSIPERNQYAYMMEGFDKDWNFSGSRRFVTYTNLDPGDYVFRVKASNNDGVWNEEGILVQINITPPFWATWWFRILVTLSILSLILGVFKMRIRSIEIQRKKLAVQVTERTADLKQKSDELVQKKDELQEAHSRLEERVKERTAELQVSNESLWREITERKQAEKTVAEKSMYLDNILRSASEYAIATTDLDFRITYYNPMAEKIHGYKAKDVIGKTVQELHTKEKVAPERFEQAIENIRRHGEHCYTVVKEEKDGTRYIDTRVSGIYDSHGKLVGFSNFARDVTEKLQAEEELKRSHEQLRSLASHLQSVREEERTHIAREIHDELGQALSLLQIELFWLEKRLPKGKIELFDKIESMSKLVDMTVETVQKIATELRPAILDNLGLIAAIEWQAKDFQKRTGIDCQMTLPTDDVDLDHSMVTAVFRIFQETLTNVARHAEATIIKIELIRKVNELMLKVQDNGKGITKAQIFDQKSIGIIGIRERVNPWEGEVKIKGIPREGTTMTVKIPLDKGK